MVSQIAVVEVLSEISPSVIEVLIPGPLQIGTTNAGEFLDFSALEGSFISESRQLVTVVTPDRTVGVIGHPHRLLRMVSVISGSARGSMS